MSVLPGGSVLCLCVSVLPGGSVLCLCLSTEWVCGSYCVCVSVLCCCFFYLVRSGHLTCFKLRNWILILGSFFCRTRFTTEQTSGSFFTLWQEFSVTTSSKSEQNFFKTLSSFSSDLWSVWMKFRILMLLYNCEDHFHLYFLSAVRSYDIIMSFSSYDGYTLNSHLTNLLPRLSHRYRGGHGFELPLEPQNCFWAFTSVQTVRMTFTCILYSQCTHMIFIIYTSYNINVVLQGAPTSHAAHED